MIPFKKFKRLATEDEYICYTKEAVNKVIFGALSYGVGKELFWGNDRLEDVIYFNRIPQNRLRTTRKRFHFKNQ